MMLTIFIDITIPLFIMIGAGVALDRAFKLDAATLSKLNFHLFVPVLLFVKIVDLKLETTAILPTGVNVYILAREYNEEPVAVSQVIIWTTRLSAAVLPFILIALR